MHVNYSKVIYENFLLTRYINDTLKFQNRDCLPPHLPLSVFFKAVAVLFLLPAVFLFLQPETGKMLLSASTPVSVSLQYNSVAIT